jgi:wyosine [tRNA(Phe)-imidazoG37] synthetase (radical SAM superfamily)
MSEHITFCPIPFDFLNVEATRFSTCCPGWQHESRFVYDEGKTAWQIWNHPKIVEFRQAILNQDWQYCQKCPNRYQKQIRGKKPSDQPVMNSPPITIQFQDNQTCNLACPSCRNHVIIEKQGNRSAVVKDFINQFGDQLPTVAMSLTGDPFANKEHLEWLQSGDHELPHVILWTNGLLLPRYWYTIKRKVSIVLMSIDAATKETYEVVRRPGKWEDAYKAIEFIGGLNSADVINEFQMNFVVQAINFREIPDFIRIGIKVGATRCQFTMIAPWPHLGMKQWKQINIADPDHPNHKEFRRVLKDPLLNHPIADTGFISEENIKLFNDYDPNSNFFSNQMFEENPVPNGTRTKE